MRIPAGVLIANLQNSAIKFQFKLALVLKLLDQLRDRDLDKGKISVSMYEISFECVSQHKDKVIKGILSLSGVCGILCKKGQSM